MPQAANPESAEIQGRALPDNTGPNNAGTAARGSWLSNEILTMVSVGIALAALLIMLLSFTNDRIERVEVRLDRLETRLDDRIDNLDAKFDALLLQLARSNAIPAQGAGRTAKPR